jgi:branched-chain amino acid transport system substrate-binding protein
VKLKITLKNAHRAVRRSARQSVVTIATATLMAADVPAYAWAAEPPIKICVIGEESAIAGASITKATQLAADEINPNGGTGGRKIQLFIYDDHASAAEAVRAFQRAPSQDHVGAEIASYISEVALALALWAGQLHIPTITPRAASTLIDAQVHDRYPQYKYMFPGWINSKAPADVICQANGDIPLYGRDADTFQDCSGTLRPGLPGYLRRIRAASGFMPF